MALPTAAPAPQASPQVIGNAFVQQYYLILHQSPEHVHKFYLDSSILCRPDSEGVMTSVTTMQAINEKILSLDFSNCFTEIETVDSQISYKNGVLIVVTGSFTARDNVRRKFTQSFFLAPQENGGYFVQNDVFRFLLDMQSKEIYHLSVDGTNDNDANKAPLTPDPESISQKHDVETAPSEGDADKDEVFSLSEDGGSGVEDEVPVDPPAQVSERDAQPTSEVVPVAQDDVPKKSYASIVKVMNCSPSPAPSNLPATKAKVAPKNLEAPVVVSAMPVHATKTLDPISNGVPEEESHEEEGHSIYIRNLPLNATAEQVEEEFKKFGPIKPGGVQVRSHKIERFCFGFVEFESLKSMEFAIEASPVMIGGRQVYAEEKRTTTRVVNGVVTNNGNGSGGRGRFQPGRGGFRNDNFRGRGSFGVNMGYKRSNFRNQVDYSGRGRGPPSHGNDGYRQRVFQNGNGRIGRTNGPEQVAVTA